MKIKGVSIQVEGPDVVLVLDRPAKALVFSWGAYDDICREIRLAWEQAAVNEQLGLPGASLPERRSFTVGRRGRESLVALIFDYRLDRLCMPWRIAKRLWRALKSKAREADCWDNRNRLIADQQFLVGAGIPIGLLTPELAPALAGIAPTSAVGTPGLICYPPITNGQKLRTGN